MSPAAQHPTPREPMRPSRRAVARGAAWSVPVIAVGAAAPAMAASPTPCPTLPAFSATDGWVISEAGTPTAGSARFASGTFVVDSDAQPLSSYSASASHSLDVVNGQSYTFQYSWTALTSNPNPMTSELLIDGTLVPGSLVDTTTSGPGGSVSATYVASATGTVTVAVRMSTSDSSFESGDDITVGAITIDCGT
ncbi:hypothetical protein [uncultured Phycicoccus sp.]|uniref:hypothetical protein n=1 Tax=uncultured Phycicoccus sp. TaxID=661422 RepID=UPI0026259AB8|nr:hypothetical protein [uncultured Phycicoccus sp.]